MRKIKAFSMVGTIVLLIVSAIAIVSLTPMVTRKIVNVEVNKSTHGRFEAYWREDGKLVSRTCGKYICGNEVICPDTGCEFNPPQGAEDIVIHAIGGGGAGGSAGPDLEEGNNSGSGKNYKSFNINQIFDVRPDASGNNYIHTFPHEMIRKTKILGSATQTPVYADINQNSSTHLFDFQKLQNKWGYVIGVACGSAGGSGGTATFTTDKDPHCWDHKERAGCEYTITKSKGISCGDSEDDKKYYCTYNISSEIKCPNNGLYEKKDVCKKSFTKCKYVSDTFCPDEYLHDLASSACEWKKNNYTVKTPGGAGGSKPPCAYAYAPLNDFAYAYAPARYGSGSGNGANGANKTVSATSEY